MPQRSENVKGFHVESPSSVTEIRKPILIKETKNGKSLFEGLLSACAEKRGLDDRRKRQAVCGLGMRRRGKCRGICRNEIRAAEHQLNSWLQEVDKIKAGIITQQEIVTSKKLNEAIASQIEDYTAFLKTKACNEYISAVKSRIRRVCNECKFKRIADFNATDFIKWLNARADEGMSASARNNYRESMVAMSNWAVDELGLHGNPFARIPKANEKADPRHERRALTLQETQKLLEAAEKRPLHDKLKVTRGNLKGQKAAQIGDKVAAKAKRTGMERRLIYAFLVYTGLRKKELASITIKQLFLDENVPFLLLKAKDEKSKRGAEVPICNALLGPLREWLDVRKSEGLIKPGDKLFNVPKALDKVLNLDLVFAGIEKKDRRDRVVDVHSLRHTHATLLKQYGVASHVAKESMRHSDIALTMNVYTHSGLEDVADGVNRLPDLMNSMNDNETKTQPTE